MKKLAALAICLAFAVCFLAAAQEPGIPGIMPPRLPFPQLTKFLDLSAVQTNQLLQVNFELARFMSEKSRRVGQVHLEIEAETHRENPVPLELGQRYYELESICRESHAAAGRAQEMARKILNKDQLAKIQMLEQLLTLAPVASEAQTANLLPMSVSVRTAPTLYPGCIPAPAPMSPIVLPMPLVTP